jgi:hypothetical protein
MVVCGIGRVYLDTCVESRFGTGRVTSSRTTRSGEGPAYESSATYDIADSPEVLAGFTER